jgi:23S rRNA (adenine2030-N6)-methyltransferase
MNYRHAYHAGNFADCMKHALLLELLDAMQRKEKPFLVLDTHAGTGRYDLTTGPAEKTGEWREGIARILAARPAALKKYCGVIDALGPYPGSPLITASVLRETDRLVACERHKEDAPLLRAAMAAIRNTAVHERDGYAAMRAFLPPAEKRALILIDPPYEVPDEFATITKNLSASYQKFNSGVYAVWYPIKHRPPVRDFFETLKLTKLRDVVSLELLLRDPTDPARMNGCGLLVVNPPYGLAAQAAPVLQALAEVLAEPGGGFAITRLIDE